MNHYRQRTGNLYRPGMEGFRISRSKIDLFLECPRCFYLDRRLGLGRPSMPGWSLNSAVDQLLKKEFDLLRQAGQAHRLMKEYGIEAIPLNHPDLPIWRDDVAQYTGALVTDSETKLEICGIVDDIWINQKKEFLIVDYKSTSTNDEISLEDEYKQGYKTQAEIYQWIFRKMGYPVSNIAYFVFANADKNRPSFDGKLEFNVSILAHQGDDSWVSPTIKKIKDCLDLDQLPDSGTDCEYCAYRQLMGTVKG